MAITNAQQYKQLMQNGGRIGLKGGGADMGASDKKSVDSRASKGYGAPSDSKPTYGGGGGDGGSKGPPSVISPPPKKPKVTTKTKDKEKNFIKDYIKNRQKLAYNVAGLIPGQKKRSAKYQKAYKDYLESMGATPPDTLTGEEEDLTDFFVNNAFDRTSPSYKDPITGEVKSIQNYGDFIAENFGAPGVKFSGNVGGLETFVKTRDADGKPLTYGFRETRGGGRDDFILPISQPVASVPEPTGYVNPLSLLTPRIAGTRFLGTEFEDEEDIESAADGGRIGAMGGGIMNTDVMGGLADGGMDESGRQMYFLGKLVKKATRAVKKITKSPFGKAALLYGLGAIGGSYGSTGKFFSKGMFSPGNIGRGLFGITAKGQAARGLPELAAKKGLFGKLGLTEGYGGFMPTFRGGIALATALPFLSGGEDDDDKFDIDAYYAANRLNPNAPLNRRILGTDFYAADGGMPSKEPVAKKTMPLLDMDGQEMDLRAEGGFVPLGRMERADDVPARLSKNEFVFTADAVRNAGEGDIDKGAEVMYNMMKNLESGGEVSEESQGLEGAREMFQTSQRLEEVI